MIQGNLALKLEDFEDSYCDLHLVEDCNPPDNIIQFPKAKWLEGAGAQEEIVNYAYNNENQLLTANDTIYDYDSNGNLIRKDDVQGATDYSWDHENRLVGIDYADGTSDEYVYDGVGKRIQTSEDGVVTNYLYDGLNCVIETDGSGLTTAKYVRGLGYGGGIGSVISANDSYYYYDGIGNVVNVADNAGSVTQNFVYDAYGNILNGAVPSPHGFSTKEHSSRSGLIHFGARLYDPTVGRFISKDPLGMINGPNVYNYCNANPINFVDPFGFCKKDGRPWHWFITEGYENWTWNPYTWLTYHAEYGGEDNPTDILDKLKSKEAPNPVDTLDRWGYKFHDIDWAYAGEAGTLSGQLFRQSIADYKLAAKTLSQGWRYGTGLHGQLHGTLASVWFPVQGTAQLIASGAVYAAEVISSLFK